MKTVLTAATLALALTSCATSKAVYTPDGKQGHALQCGGTAMTWNDCQEKAGQICGSKGYEVLDRQENTSYVLGSPAISRTMLIACKDGGV